MWTVGGSFLLGFCAHRTLYHFEQRRFLRKGMRVGFTIHVISTIVLVLIALALIAKGLWQ